MIHIRTILFDFDYNQLGFYPRKKLSHKNLLN